MRKTWIRNMIIRYRKPWVAKTTGNLKKKIEKNRKLIKASTDKAKNTVWETEIEEWTTEITWITEIFTSVEVQRILNATKVVKRLPATKKSKTVSVKKVAKVAQKAKKQEIKLKAALKNTPKGPARTAIKRQIVK